MFWLVHCQAKPRHSSWSTDHHAPKTEAWLLIFSLYFKSTIRLETKLKWPTFAAQHRLLNWPQSLITTGGASSTNNTSCIHVYGLFYWQTAKTWVWPADFMFVTLTLSDTSHSVERRRCRNYFLKGREKRSRPVFFLLSPNLNHNFDSFFF